MLKNLKKLTLNFKLFKVLLIPTILVSTPFLNKIQENNNLWIFYGSQKRFKAFTNETKCNLHIENIYGTNNHHIIESCYKGLARSLRAALELDLKNKNTVPSTKGSL